MAGVGHLGWPIPLWELVVGLSILLLGSRLVPVPGLPLVGVLPGIVAAGAFFYWRALTWLASDEAEELRRGR